VRQWYQGSLVASKGTCQITAGNTSVTVVHNLGYDPNIGITPLDDLGGAYWWISAHNTTQFTLTVSSPDPINVHNFEYMLV
jgi:hypothetical protein